MNFLVVDGNSIANRAFYGIKGLSTKGGQPTGAIYGFLNTLLALQKQCSPHEIAIAFDLAAPTFRHKEYDGYKATRKGMPPELASQMPILKTLLGQLGYTTVSCDGFEADDILGTLAAACTKRGDACFLATGDRDSLQLVSESVTVLLATTKEGSLAMDPAAVQQKYGVAPPALIEVKALMGDSSDNIPGVPGIGEKTALALVQKFGTLEGVYQNLDDPAIKPGQRKKLAENRPLATLSRRLGTIFCAVPIATETGAYKRNPPTAEAAATLAALEMPAMVQRLGLPSAAPDLPLVQPQSPPSTFAGRVFVAAQEGGWCAVQGRQVFALSLSQLCDLLESDAAVHCFDAKALYHIALKQGGMGSAIAFDGTLAAYLLHPAASEYSLPSLCTQYGVVGEFSCTEFPFAGQLQPLCETLQEKIAQSGMQPLLQDIELPLARVLADMEQQGMLVDKAGLAAYGETLRVQKERLLALVFQQVGYEFNLNSPKQLGVALFETLGLPTGKKTKTGYSTNAETLERLRPYHPAVDNILQYRSYQKLHSTYVEGLLKVLQPDGRMHTTFKQTEARTGRLASSEPNMQNIPIRTPLGSELRKFFVAGAGNVLVDADYSQIELRLLAHIAGDATMQQAFLQGQDIHKSTAAKVHGIPLNEVTPQQRSAAKAVNFGIVYGIGAYSLSQDIGVSVKQADEFIQSYLRQFPKVKQYMDDAIAFGKQNGYVQTLFGRRRPLPELSGGSFATRALGERMAMNTPIQGTAADVIKLAMVKVWQRLRCEGLAARLILQVHDELIIEAPEHEAQQAAAILQQEMQNAVQYSVPLTAAVTLGKSWFEAH